MGGRYNGQVVHFIPVVERGGGGRYNGQVVHFQLVVGRWGVTGGVAVQWPKT